MSILQSRRYQPLDADLTAVAVSGLAAARTTYTPTITASVGTFTTVSAAGRYVQIGKLVFVSIVVTITTNGTAAGAVIASLPVANTGTIYVLNGRVTVTGEMLQGVINASASTVSIFVYNNTYPGGDGRTVIVSGVYEAA